MISLALFPLRTSSTRRVFMACAALVAIGFSAACRIDVSRTAPPLADMDEPLSLREAPRDEAARLALPLGTFTGAYVRTSQTRLDQRREDSEGILIERVVENSPADAAGLAVGDLIYEVAVDGGARVDIAWPSEWRKLELDAQPGVAWTVRFDRAQSEQSTRLVPVARVHPASAEAIEHFREEQHAGIVLRTATEVEARGAGLGPGAGAVVIGLSARSPWRSAGVQFEDLILSIAGREAAHPQVVLDEIRKAGEEQAEIELIVLRRGQRMRLEVLSSVRFEEVGELNIPLLYSFERDRGRVEHELLFGLISYEETEVAYAWRFLWLISFRGGQADRLVEVAK